MVCSVSVRIYVFRKNRRSEMCLRRNSRLGTFVYPDRPATASVHSSTPIGTALGRGLLPVMARCSSAPIAGVSSAVSEIPGRHRIGPFVLVPLAGIGDAFLRCGLRQNHW